jgi:hypothetical protein
MSVTYIAEVSVQCMEDSIKDFICIRRNKYLLGKPVFNWRDIYTYYVYMLVILFQAITITSASEGITFTKIWFLNFKNTNAEYN